MTGGCTIRRGLQASLYSKPAACGLKWGLRSHTNVDHANQTHTCTTNGGSSQNLRKRNRTDPTSWGPSSIANTHRSPQTRRHPRRFRVGKAGGNRCGPRLGTVVEGIPGFGSVILVHSRSGYASSIRHFSVAVLATQPNRAPAWDRSRLIWSKRFSAIFNRLPSPTFNDASPCPNARRTPAVRGDTLSAPLPFHRESPTYEKAGWTAFAAIHPALKLFSMDSNG